MEYFNNIDYLLKGTPKQKNTYEVLVELKIFDVLKQFDPILVGTIPLDIDIDNSDLDIICFVQDFSQFRLILIKHYLVFDNFKVYEQYVNNTPTTIATFDYKGFLFEIFGQQCPVKSQNGYLHMIVEARLLELAGENVREDIRCLKAKNIKTEPAFGKYFNLSGDPYNRLIELANVSDIELKKIINDKMDTGTSASLEKDKIIFAAQQFVKGQLKHDSSGHDWWHIFRVTKTAETIAEQEKANVFVCRLTALLHDIADEKFNNSESEGLEKVRTWLKANLVDDNSSYQVIAIISSMSFKGGNRPPMTTLEGQVVQDADRLDAIGAMGISRVFAYSGAKGRTIHDPDVPQRTEMTSEEYRNGKDTAINHFYEKLLKLKDLMNTDYGRKLAYDRHVFMEYYLEQFYQEWSGVK